MQILFKRLKTSSKRFRESFTSNKWCELNENKKVLMATNKFITTVTGHYKDALHSQPLPVSKPATP